MHLKVPIYPVALEGFQRVWPRGKAFQGFFPLKVQFGDPIHPPENPPDREAAYTQLTAELKRRVAAMWEKLHQEGEPRPEKKQAAAAD
jgi:1-acyl-sn-glycerol-3-phosphate acyltransferase